MAADHREQIDEAIAPDGCVRDPEAQYPTAFKCGEVVVDGATLHLDVDGTPYPTDDTGLAIVVRAGRAQACDVVLKDGASLAERPVNQQYPVDAPVVTVAFVATLDRAVGEWRTDWERHTLDWRIPMFEAASGIPIRTYDYPAPRLVHARETAVDVPAALGGDES